MTEPSVVLRCASTRVRYGSAGASIGNAAIALGVLLLLVAVTFIAGLGPACALACAGFAIVAFSARSRPGGEVTLDEQGLRLTTSAGERRIRGAEVRGGFVVAAEASVILRLGSGRRVTLCLEDRSAPQRVLDHVLGIDKQALVAPLRGTLGAFTIGLVTFLGAYVVAGTLAGHLPGLTGLFAPPLLAVLATVSAVARFGHPQAIVGADGIRVTGGVRTRFIPFTEIEGATLGAAPWQGLRQVGSSVLVQRRHKKAFHLPTIGQTSDEVRGLLQRIRTGAGALSSGGRDKLLGMLERKGRTPATWKADLHRVAAAGGGFRDLAVGPDDLEAVLHDPTALADRRVGAALALRAIDPSRGPRIRVAAAASANEKLRVALEAASDGEVDSEALDDALAVRAAD
jgi:hypothetical protein